MRTTLSKRELAIIESAFSRLNKLYFSLVDTPRDILLNYGNGTVSTQLNCALASLECITQEMY